MSKPFCLNDYYPVLKDLRPELVSNIKTICIFGVNESEVLMITKDDKFFSFGFNSFGCLGLGHNNPIQEPTLVEELCQKQVIDICYGSKHVMSLTNCGQCYSWGDNSCGQLGDGSRVDKNSPKIITALIDKKIVAINCGAYHSLVLSNEGEVYAFGYNYLGQIGCGHYNNQLLPVKIFRWFSQKVVSISCGFNHSLALTERGYVFSWGCNEFGQLGVGNYLMQDIPKQISGFYINGVLFKQIVCGASHSLLLSTDGDIYAFGYNEFGQNSCFSSQKQNIPIKINSNLKFVEIGSHFMTNISVGLANNGFCYVWGKCFNTSVFLPEKTIYKSIHKVFITYSTNKITYKPMPFEDMTINFELQSRNRILESLTKAFNNQELSDFKFKVEKQFIYVQKLYLMSCCKHFESMLSQNWIKSETNQLEITHYSYNVFYAFIKYLYTDSIDIRAEEVIDLYDLANSYLEEDLKVKCVQLIKKVINIENFCALYSSAINHNNQELEDFCYGFALNKLNEICKTQAFLQMDENYCKRLFIRAADNKRFKTE